MKREEARGKERRQEGERGEERISFITVCLYRNDFG